MSEPIITKTVLDTSTVPSDISTHLSSVIEMSVISSEETKSNSDSDKHIDETTLCNSKEFENSNNVIKNDTQISIKQDEKDKDLEKSKFLGEAPLVKTIWTLMYPDLIAKLVSASYSFVDSIYISNLAGSTAEERSQALAAVSLTTPIEQGCQMGVAYLFASGLSPLLSRYLGEGNAKMARRTLGNLYFMAIVLGIIYPIIMVPCLRPFLIALGASDEAGTLKIALDYITIITCGAIFYNFAYGNNNMIRAEGQSRWSASIKVISCVFNICLDPVFISTFKMNANGAAVCTVLSCVITSVLGFSFYMFKKSSVRLTCSGMKPDGKLLKQGAIIGISGSLMTISASIVSLVYNKLMIMYSPYPSDSIETTELLSVIGAFSKTTFFFFLPLLALAQGVLPILSYCRGAHLKDRFQNCIKICAIECLILSVCIAILGFSCAPYIARAFSSSETFISVYSSFIRYFSVGTPLGVFFFTLLPCLQSTGHGMFAGLIALCKNCLFYIIFSFILCYYLNDYRGIMYACPISEACTAIMCIIIGLCKKNAILNMNTNSNTKEEK